MKLRVSLTTLCAWVFSTAVHAMGLCIAILLAADFSVVPRVAPFRWDISLIAASQPEPMSSDKPTPVLASSTQEFPATGEAVSRVTSPTMHRVSVSSRAVIKKTIPATPGPRPESTHHHRVAETSQVKESSDVLRHPAGASPQESSAELHSLPASTAWLVTSSTRPEMPPLEVDAADQSVAAMAPSIPEAPRIVNLRAPQLKPTPVLRQIQPDYGWLASLVTSEVEQVKRYPSRAKWHRWQGRVVVQAVIHEDGRISDIQVVDSSGHDTLDHDAIALLERISPLRLQYPLAQSTIVVRIPIGYHLE